jgi:hypothetical protein
MFIDACKVRDEATNIDLLTGFDREAIIGEVTRL